MAKDTIDLIYEGQQRIEKSLADHIITEDLKFDKIAATQEVMKSDIHVLKKDVALTQQRNGYINAFIATCIAAIVSIFANLFTAR